jgi:hypothetical protein
MAGAAMDRSMKILKLTLGIEQFSHGVEKMSGLSGISSAFRVGDIQVAVDPYCAARILR